MNTSRLVKIIIVIAVLVVGGFTLRAVLNTQDILSSTAENVEQQAGEGEMNIPATGSQSLGISSLDLLRIIDLSVIPHDIAVDAQGNLYVVGADVENPQIYKYDREGSLLASWGSRGSREGQFEFASPPGGPPLEGGSVALDENGDVYISDVYNNRVQKFDSDGNFLGMWTTIGDGAPFNVPGPISADINGNIYVADFDGVHQFTLDGTYVRMLPTAGEVAFDSQGNLYGTVAFENKVARLDEKGKIADTWGGDGDSQDGLFNFPLLMEIDNNDAIYVSDHSGRVQIFDTEGNFLGRFNLTTWEHSQLKTTAILAMDNENHIYVGAGDRKTVYVLRSLDESQKTDIYPEGSIASVLEKDGRFTTFLMIFGDLRGAYLTPWPKLQDPAYSVALFVPTNEAFSKVPLEIIERLETDKTFADDLLTLHQIDKKLYSKDFGLLKSWPTGLANQQVVIEIEGDKFKFEGANVIETDIEAGNYSTIHVIDAVTGLDRVAGR